MNQSNSHVHAYLGVFVQVLLALPHMDYCGSLSLSSNLIIITEICDYQLVQFVSQKPCPFHKSFCLRFLQQNIWNVPMYLFRFKISRSFLLHHKHKCKLPTTGTVLICHYKTQMSLF